MTRLVSHLAPFLALLLVAAGATARVTASEEVLDEPVRLRLLAPFATPRNTLFYSGFGVPLLRQARVAPPGTLDVSLRTSRTHIADTGLVDGRVNRVDALHLEYMRLGFALAVHERIALWSEAQIAGWDERRDRFDIHSRGTSQHALQGEERKSLEGNSTSRHENLSLLTVGALIDVWRGDDPVDAVGVSMQVKTAGFRRGDLTNSGTFDVAATVHASIALHDRVVLHANGGVVVPLGDPWIFEDAPGFNARPFGQGGVGVTWAATEWLSLGASIDMIQSPFEREVGFIDRHALTISGGARLLLGRFSIELGGGTGMNTGSADWLFWVELGYTSRPLWTPPAD